MRSDRPAPPRRRVVLRYRGTDNSPRLTADLDPVQVEAMQQEAERLGLPRHPDPQLASLLSAIHLRDDVPAQLYAAAAAVLNMLYATADNE